MEGWPVWLASVSKRTKGGRGEIIPAQKWSDRLRREAEGVLMRTLAGVGDDSRQRCFRMCITLCLHRRLTVDEIARLPTVWHSTPVRDIAGAPVEVLWERGIAPSLSTKPCRNYTQEAIGTDCDGDPIWLPMPCGDCDTCQARERAMVEFAHPAGLVLP